MLLIRKAAIGYALYLQDADPENSETKYIVSVRNPAESKKVIGIETSIGIGSWVRSPQELVYSYKLAEKAIGYRYLLGGSLLLDMEEKENRQQY